MTVEGKKKKVWVKPLSKGGVIRGGNRFAWEPSSRLRRERKR